MAPEAELDVVRAAGGLLWRRERGAIEIAIVHRPKYDDWSVPKGKLEPGEDEIDGALREVFEETGFRARVGEPVGEVRYAVRSQGRLRPKIVRYWAMEAAEGSFVPTSEVDELRWVSPGEAQKLLTRDHDRALVARFAAGAEDASA